MNNKVIEEGIAAMTQDGKQDTYANGFIDGREMGYYHCGSCSHAWYAHNGECQSYMPDGSICGCKKIVTEDDPAALREEISKLSTRIDELLSEATEAAEELARVRGERDDIMKRLHIDIERGMYISLRQVVRAYRTSVRLHDEHESGCNLCIKADALLETKPPEPVDTRETK